MQYLVSNKTTIGIMSHPHVVADRQTGFLKAEAFLQIKTNIAAEFNTPEGRGEKNKAE